MSAQNSLFFYFFFVVPRVFITLLLLNIVGLVPYVYGVRCQFVFTFPIALGLWLAINSSSLIFNPVVMVSHYTPLACPVVLSPLLSLIELVRKLIRSLTLRLRLSINLSTGHVIMTLVAIMTVNCLLNIKTIRLFFSLFLMVFYTLFEVGVSLIQSFVFSLLVSQYLDEHPLC